ncbi:hypothetical protein V5F72_11180 [Xanthobacter flavus]|uniref:hypothetical protein n=1 Tax=Xanthobacter flavus TaxID=281 RepID=UPI003726D3D6
MREDRGAPEPLEMRRHPGTPAVLLPLPCPEAVICLEYADTMSAQQAFAFRKDFDAALIALGAVSLCVLGAVALWH